LKKSILQLVVFIFLASVSLGQNHLNDQKKEIFDQKYGTEVLLHEGKIYYPESNVAGGNPYWGTKGINEGDIVLGGKRFYNQKIMYDLFFQNFILIFNDLNGAEKQIILDSDKIDSVFLNGFVFIKNPIPGIDKDFVQLVYNGTISCYFFWEKQRTIKSETEIKGYSFSNEKKSMYIIYNSELYRFKNKGEFLNIFQAQYRNQIKQYLSKNSIRIRTINTQQLAHLILHIEKDICKV
jgi:hypothetical protein